MKNSHDVMRHLLTTIFWLGCFALFFTPAPAFSCSIFSLHDKENAFLAGNEDWYQSTSALKIVPATAEEFGYVIFGVAAYLDSHPQIGLNEKGLAADWATIPRSAFQHEPDRKSLSSPLLPELMKHCESVKDVITSIRKYNIPHFAEEHLLVADRFGNSAVLEWHHDTVQVVTSEKPYQLITNFNILDPSGGWYPCERFSAGERLLEAGRGDVPPLEYITSILAAMHAEGTFQTLYSYVFDLETTEIVLYNHFDYSQKAILHLEQLLNQGSQVLQIDELHYHVIEEKTN